MEVMDMRAFVLSGGGTRGALEVGALGVLLERGIQPEMLVGTSAGALNAAYLAVHPTLEGVRELARVWREVDRDSVYPGNPLTVAWRLLAREDSLFSNRRFREFVEASMPHEANRILDIEGVRLFITATNLNTGELRVFGDAPSDVLLDAVMASTALPPFHPPWVCDGQQYVDGGAVANLPVRVAVDRGATEIYAIHVAPREVPAPVSGVMNVALGSAYAVLNRLAEEEIEDVIAAPGVTVHYIRLDAFQRVSPLDFGYSAEMIAEGRRVMEAYLREPQPLCVSKGALDRGLSLVWMRGWRNLSARLERLRQSARPRRWVPSVRRQEAVTARREPVVETSDDDNGHKGGLYV
jgi:NTE family protein